VLRPRTMLYTALWGLVGFGLVFALFIRSDIEMNVAQVRNPTYITLSDGTIRNVYDVRLLNKQGGDRQFHLSLASDDILRIDIEGSEGRVVDVSADEVTQVRVYVSARPQDPAASRDRTAFRFWLEDLGSGDRAYVDSHFNGTGTAND